MEFISAIQVVRLLCFITIGATLFGCNTTTKTDTTISVSDLVSYIPTSRDIEIETMREVFQLTEEQRLYARGDLKGISDPWTRASQLRDFMFNRDHLAIEYSNSANTIASETYENAAANCLSLTILAYSLAKEAGFRVEFQEIQVPEFWTQQQGFNLINGHVNLKLTAKQPARLWDEHPQFESFVLDFEPNSQTASNKAKAISKKGITAYFYNNKGAEMLMQQEFEKAGAYLYNSLKLAPQDSSAWNNMGSLLKNLGHLEAAEKAYQQAINIRKENWAAWENLALIYAMTKREDEAQSIAKRVQKQRSDNPNYHLKQAEAYEEKSEFSLAISHYKKALRLSPRQHDLYFGLARNYFKLENLDKSKHFLELAAKHAPSSDDNVRYRSKLRHIQNLQNL